MKTKNFNNAESAQQIKITFKCWCKRVRARAHESTRAFASIKQVVTRTGHRCTAKPAHWSYAIFQIQTEYEIKSKWHKAG